ncbi:MAG TPA: outer membrane protein [Xanthobacteraceae bacterium]|nr:outer membrane protein [Xanthobacteraceae bacterium]
MKRVFRSGVAVAALIGLAGSAYAADIARRVQKPVAPAPYVAPVYNWSGLYAGVYGGGGWGTAEISGTPGTGSFDVSGGLVGGTLGYNWQAGPWVYGLETDIGWSGIKDSAACGGLSCSVKNSWLGTTRARLGYATDRIMPYITGGAAYGEVKAEASGLGGASSTRAGWTLGGGMEFALNGPWTAKVEYLYADLGSFNCGVSCGVAAGSGDVSFRTHIVRAGLNYRF